MRKISAFILALQIACLSAGAQTLVWKNYSSMYAVNGITISGGKAWGATAGGVFSYNPTTGQFNQYTSTEGLSNIQATAIVSDSGVNVLVGEADGSIDELAPNGNILRSQSDIAKSSQISRGILRMSVVGDTIFACTPFGVVLISRSSFRVLDTYMHFVAGQGSVKANSVSTFDGLIFVASQFGLSSAPQSSINLSAPDLWSLLDSLGFSDGVNALAVFNGSLYVGTQHGLFYTTDGRSFMRNASFPNSAVYSMSTGTGYLLVNSAQGLYKLGTDGSVGALYTGGVTLNDVVPLSDTEAVAATNQGILRIGSGTTQVLPPGPATNIVSDLAVDSSGNLWCSTNGTSDVGVALMKLSGTVWTNLNMSNSTGLTTNTFYQVSSLGGDLIGAGSWGGPGDSSVYRGEFALIDGDSITDFSAGNSPLVGYPVDPKYILLGGSAADASGNIWVINRSSYSNYPILAFSRSQDKWYHFYNYFSPVAGFAPVAVDAFGGVWTGDQYGISGTTTYAGLLYFNANGTLANTSDDKSFIINQGNSVLLSNHVNSLLVDSEDQLWIGTDLGMDVIYDPDPSGSIYLQSIYSLLDQNINSIDYDALDQKWVATNTGVYVISRDGNSQIASYNMTNSPLPSNDVLAVACDRKNGIVYFATEYGITELKTGVEQPVQSMTKLKIFPDPARIPTTSSIHIEGLAANSQIKVFTVDGRLVDQFQAQGGKIAYWNGTDSSGSLLPSGVYIVVAYASDGSQSVVGKIALIRE